jgi:hypothetical protein
MSDDESDAEFERRYPQKRRGMPVWAILLIVLGSTVLFGGVMALVVGSLLFGGSTVPQTGPRPAVVMNATVPPQVQERFTRAEFEQLVTGKTVAEVKAALGEPPVSGGADGDETWMYRGRTTDPATGLTDDRTDVEFRGGKVVRVSYHTDAPPGGPGPSPGGR